MKSRRKLRYKKNEIVWYRNHMKQWQLTRIVEKQAAAGNGVHKTAFGTWARKRDLKKATDAEKLEYKLINGLSS